MFDIRVEKEKGLGNTVGYVLFCSVPDRILLIFFLLSGMSHGFRHQGGQEEVRRLAANINTPILSLNRPVGLPIRHYLLNIFLPCTFRFTMKGEVFFYLRRSRSLNGV